MSLNTTEFNQLWCNFKCQGQGLSDIICSFTEIWMHVLVKLRLSISSKVPIMGHKMNSVLAEEVKDLTITSKRNRSADLNIISPIPPAATAELSSTNHLTKSVAAVTALFIAALFMPLQL